MRSDVTKDEDLDEAHEFLVEEDRVVSALASLYVFVRCDTPAAWWTR